MFIKYERVLALKYVQTWARVPYPLFPILNDRPKNVAFCYQALLAGGAFSGVNSAYLDYHVQKLHPLITRYNGFEKALLRELKCNTQTGSSLSDFIGLKTGDLIVGDVAGYKIVYFIEEMKTAYYFYSLDPALIKASLLPPASSYTAYLLPDYFEV